MMNQRTKKLNEWKPVIERYQTSGLSRLKFCKENNVSYPQFKYYLNKLKSTSNNPQASSLKSVTVIHSSSSKMDSKPYTIHLPNGICCQIPSGIERNTILKVLEALCHC